jgi:hypothetical protein
MPPGPRVSAVPDFPARLVDSVSARQFALFPVLSRLRVRTLLRPDGLARRRRALEAVEKVVTTPTVFDCAVPLDALHIGSG